MAILNCTEQYVRSNNALVRDRTVKTFSSFYPLLIVVVWLAIFISPPSGRPPPPSAAQRQWLFLDSSSDVRSSLTSMRPSVVFAAAGDPSDYDDGNGGGQYAEDDGGHQEGGAGIGSRILGTGMQAVGTVLNFFKGRRRSGGQGRKTGRSELNVADVISRTRRGGSTRKYLRKGRRTSSASSTNVPLSSERRALEETSGGEAEEVY